MKTKFFIPILAGALTLTGCSEDFLETEPTQFVSSDQVAEASVLNPSLQNANISGLYSTMYLTGTGGTDGHVDFVQKGYDKKISVTLSETALVLSLQILKS